MDATRDCHTKSERKRQIPYDITYMWNLKYETNELITKQKQTHGHRKQTYGYQRGKWGNKLEVGVSRYNYVYKIDNKILLDRTGNYIQHLVTTQWKRL